MRRTLPGTRVRVMARYGINTERAYGVPVAALRRLAREVGRDHELAAALWATGVHEARILAGIVDDQRLVGDEQMERWVAALDWWNLCDQCCANPFVKSAAARERALTWSGRGELFVRRAGFTLMAQQAIHELNGEACGAGCWGRLRAE